MHEASTASSANELLARHQDLVVRACLCFAGIPATKERSHTDWPCRSYGKRPLGRHGDMSTGRLVCWASVPRSRFSSWTGSYTRKLAKYSALRGPWLTASCSGNTAVLWMNRHVNFSTTSTGKLVTTQAIDDRSTIAVSTDFCFD